MTNFAHKQDCKDFADQLTKIDTDYIAGDIDFYDEFEGGILDSNYTFTNTGELKSINLMLAYGGPTIWAEFFVGADYAQVVYSWAGDVVRRDAYCPTLTEWVIETLGSGVKMVGA
jgi:hypothetical protein